MVKCNQLTHLRYPSIANVFLHTHYGNGNGGGR